MIEKDLEDLLPKLIALPSVTPDDAGCQTLLIQELEALGFAIQRFHQNGADSFWATHGHGRPVIVLAGHTDVVPIGQVSAWHTPPFELTRQGDRLFGRGVADMKGSLVCMLSAAKQLLSTLPNHPGTLAFLVTSAEEGPSMHGTPIVLEALAARGQSIDCVIVGEPTAQQQTGDMLKHGRRGSLTGALTLHGKQGHIAYPHLAENPITLAFPALHQLTQITWDEGNADFGPTSFQISNIHAGTGAGNVIPGELTALFNFRYSPLQTAADLQSQVAEVLDNFGLRYELVWTHFGKPYLTPVTHPLVKAAARVIQDVVGLNPKLSTTGGTSDARYFADYTEGIIELGPVGETIHQVNECANINDLRQYYLILCRLLSNLFATA